MNKKGDISFQMIIYLILGLLVLVLVAGFATGSFQKLFQGVGTAAQDELEAAQSACRNDCAKAKQAAAASGINGWSSSRYCTLKRELDVDKSGNIDPIEFFSCWNPVIKVNCKTTVIEVARGTEKNIKTNKTKDETYGAGAQVPLTCADPDSGGGTSIFAPPKICVCPA